MMMNGDDDEYSEVAIEEVCHCRLYLQGEHKKVAPLRLLLIFQQYMKIVA